MSGKNIREGRWRMYSSGVLRAKRGRSARRATVKLAVVVVAILAGVAAVPRPSAAIAQSGAPFDRLASLVEQKMREYRIPGVALGVFRDDRVTTRGFGVTNVDDPQPIAPDTIFALASISKTVTATAIVRLSAQGLIDLHAPVQRYLPDFRVADEAASRDVTMLNLLTHTPGWEGQLTVPDHGVNTLADFVAGMRDIPQLAPPGRVWSYNNAGFSVAGRVIEVVTGRSYQDAVRTLVFQPAQLTSATTVLGEVTTPLRGRPSRSRRPYRSRAAVHPVGQSSRRRRRHEHRRSAHLRADAPRRSRARRH